MEGRARPCSSEALGLLKLKRAELLPLIVNPAPERLPRGASLTDDRDAGRCLIALTYANPKAGIRKRVIVRNCWESSSGHVTVENMREFQRGGARATMFRGIGLKRLLEGLPGDFRFHVVNGPFMVAKPFHNCLVEMNPAEWAKVWATHHDESVNSLEARAEEKAEDFEATPTLRLFKAHWRERKVNEGWDARRILRLCKLYGLTPLELAELIQWAPGHMLRFMNGATGVRLPGPVAVWFYFLENVRCGVSVFPTNFVPQETAV